MLPDGGRLRLDKHEDKVDIKPWFSRPWPMAAQQVAGADLAVGSPLQAGPAFAAFQVKLRDTVPATRWPSVDTRYVGHMGITGRLLDQWRTPIGWLGRVLACVLNISPSKVNECGSKHISTETDYTILDVGRGGGVRVRRLAGMATGGKVSTHDSDIG
jgi:hypothetical protein